MGTGALSLLLRSNVSSSNMTSPMTSSLEYRSKLKTTKCRVKAWKMKESRIWNIKKKWHIVRTQKAHLQESNTTWKVPLETSFTNLIKWDLAVDTFPSCSETNFSFFKLVRSQSLAEKLVSRMFWVGKLCQKTSLNHEIDSYSKYSNLASPKSWFFNTSIHSKCIFQ